MQKSNSRSVAIIGTVGIPAIYGGFETLTEYLTKYIGDKIAFTVFCSSKIYPVKLENYNNANLKYIPLKGNGIQSIPYDIISLFKAAKDNETILILGVSGCVILPFFRIFYKNRRIIVNIDGLEHRREKWSPIVKKFLKYSESLAIRHADEVITDNEAIRRYVTDEYEKNSTLIAYAGDQVENLELKPETKLKYSIPEKYAFKVCRIEPENNIKLILEVFSKINLPLIIVGNWSNSIYGQKLKEEYSDSKNITLLDPIYDQNILNQIRSNCVIYLHGHSAGGTNPSLIEAMYLGLPIFTFDCEYNKETTYYKALYFKDSAELSKLLRNTPSETLKVVGNSMGEIAKDKYTWEKISTQYFNLLLNKGNIIPNEI